jgi:oligosaccharyltransferase complex subunit gamma
MSAPVVSVYPAVEGPRKPASGKTDPAKYDFSSGFDPAPLAEQLSHHTPIPIPYRAPINWGKIGTTLFFAANFLLFLRFFKPVLTGRLVWIIMTVVPSLAFMGGLMFVQIRASPWQMPNGQWMAQGYANQFGKEVQMVAIICKPNLFVISPGADHNLPDGALAGAFLALILVTPYVSPARQRVQIYTLVLIIAFIYSSLLSLFRFKNRGLCSPRISSTFR